MQTTLPERARALEKRVRSLLNGPSAFLLPAPVREVIRDLAALVRELAELKEST